MNHDPQELGRQCERDILTFLFNVLKNNACDYAGEHLFDQEIAGIIMGNKIMCTALCDERFDWVRAYVPCKGKLRFPHFLDELWGNVAPPSSRSILGRAKKDAGLIAFDDYELEGLIQLNLDPDEHEYAKRFWQHRRNFARVVLAVALNWWIPIKDGAPLHPSDDWTTPDDELMMDRFPGLHDYILKSWTVSAIAPGQVEDPQRNDKQYEHIREIALQWVKDAGNNKSKAARENGISRRHLYRLLEPIKK